jgi:hypothetical protein
MSTQSPNLIFGSQLRAKTPHGREVPILHPSNDEGKLDSPMKQIKGLDYFIW